MWGTLRRNILRDEGEMETMAQKRMFTKKIVDSDAFLGMPLSSQCLYFHLNMRADDDGFIGNPKTIMKMINASEDDLKILILKRFILVLDDGVIVIKHWRMHNCISQNKYTETPYIEQKMKLFLTENGAYSTTHGVPISEAGKMRNIVDLEKKSEGIDKNLDTEKNSKSKYSTEFERFWSVYPRNDGKGMAYNQYKARLNDGYSQEELITAAMNYREECIRDRTEKKYIKMAKTFLGAATPFLDYLPRKNVQVDIQELPATSGNSGVDFNKYL